MYKWYKKSARLSVLQTIWLDEDCMCYRQPNTDDLSFIPLQHSNIDPIHLDQSSQSIKTHEVKERETTQDTSELRPHACV